MTTTYTIQTKVQKIVEEKRLLRSVKTGEKDSDGKEIIRNDYDSRGWFVLFEDSHEMIGLGAEKPDMVVGQPVEIIIIPRAMK